MEFVDIAIENFGTIENVKLVLNTPGMILITGQNRDAPKADSNGSGKSLLLDAICWCLWGETVRGLTTDDVVRRQAGKDCAVRLTIKDSDTTYIVSRHRKDSRIDKPNDLRLFINGVEKGKKMKNLQEIIDGIIGFDFGTFCAMMPGAGVSAASLTDTKIKELLEKLLQTEQLSIAYAAARDRHKALEAELKAAAAEGTAAQMSLNALEKEVAQLHEVEQNFTNNKKEKLVTAKKRIQELVTDKAVCQAHANTYKPLQEKLQALKAELQASRQKFDTDVLEPHGFHIGVLQGKIAKHEQAIRLIDHDVAARKKKIAELGALGGTCPTCESTVSADHIASCAATYAQQSEEQHEQRRLENGQLLLLRHDLQTCTTAVEVARQSAVAADTVMQRSIKQLETESAAAYIQQVLLKRLTSDLAEAEKSLDAIEAEQLNFDAIFKAKKEKADQLVEVVMASVAKQQELEKEEKLCRFWVEGFSPAGLRSYMLDYVTPILNDRAEYYSKILTAGEMKVVFTTKTLLKNGEEKDKFQILVEQAHGSDLYKGSSKGEKARADLIIAMALGDLATFRTAKQLPWRFLDEPFENIDDAGNEAVIQLLNDQKSRYKTVFVVTHKPAFKKLFTQRVSIVKENGVSSLEAG